MSSQSFVAINIDGIEPEISRPAHEKLLLGDPVHTAWNMEERDGLYAGVWQSTPGKWLISYDEWEFCHILSGVSVITDESGYKHHLSKGDSFILRPGFKGTWQVIETTRKEYVIRL